MTEAKRKRYTREFKQDAVALVACERYTIAEAPAVSRPTRTCRGWKREIETDGTQAFRGLGVRAARPRICIDSERRTGDSGSGAAFKKSDGLLREPKIVGFAFMKDHSEQLPRANDGRGVAGLGIRLLRLAHTASL